MDSFQKRKRFEQPAPVHYVAGIGRGATGFTTRSDIGPYRPASAGPEEPAGYVAGRGRGATGFGSNPEVAPMAPGAGRGRGAGGHPGGGDDDDDRGDYSDSNFDAWGGFNDRFTDSSTPYEQDDEDADALYAAVDEKMDSRRKQRREAKMQEMLSKYRSNRPKLQQEFAPLKKELATISEEEWNAIPDIGDYTIKRRKYEVFTPVPDTLLERARQESAQTNIDTSLSGIQTPSGSMTPQTDLRALGVARESMLAVKLKSVEDSVSGQTTVDPMGYVSRLQSMKTITSAELGDIKKIRTLLKSVTTTNPSHGPGWISAARLEEIAGKISAARSIIMQGCEACPTNEDVWIEASRLQTPQNAKAVLARAVTHIPQSVKIWLAAANLEVEVKAKKAVLRKALELIPNSVRLWKEAIKLEDEEDARIMLGRAVECIPQSVDLWLALARLESYNNAKQVLNKARQAIPTEPLIWITAAALEEAENKLENTEKIIEKAVKTLNANQVIIDREQWLKYAQEAEKGGHIKTCAAIIKHTIDIGIEPDARRDTWVEDAERVIKTSGSIETARAILAHALSVFPAKKSLWLRAADLEKQHGTRESLDELLKRAVVYCPNAEVLWLMAAKEQWLAGNVAGARAILNEAFAANPDSEAIWLAAFKVENENAEYDRARKILEKAREKAPTKRVWMKSAKFEREQGNRNVEKELLDKALEMFPDFDKLWMMRGQCEEDTGDKETAREIYKKALVQCPKSIPLWICAAMLEEKLNNTARARAVLETARFKNPKSPQLWLAAVRVENRAGNTKMGQSLLAKGLQECPTSGILWAEAIELEPRPTKRAKSQQAVKQCDQDPHVLVAVAKLFWLERRLDKARSWFKRAVALNPDLGDAWATYYRFELQHGTPEEQQAVVSQCVAAEPHHGELWIAVSKRPENFKLTTEQIMKRVAAAINDVM